MPPALKFTAAVAQLEQEFFNTPANLAKAIAAIHEAANDGADIVVFPECFLGQFPYWAQYYQSSTADFAAVSTALFDGAVSVKGDECRLISKAAREAGVHVVMGANELSDRPGSATIYNTMLFFDREGKLYHRHRKIMPTYAERLIHGQGDGRGLRVHETDIGRLGGLICWENHMTLSKYAMAAMGEEIHIATWPGMWRSGDPTLSERIMEPDPTPPFVCDMEVAIREYSIETGNFVLSASTYLPPENISAEWRERIPSLQADWAIGGSAIVAPGGTYLVAPVIGQEKILLAEIDHNSRRLWKSWFDPIGHYSRPDIYSLQMHDPDGREPIYWDSVSPEQDLLTESGPREGDAHPGSRDL
jgi:nitrilase